MGEAFWAVVTVVMLLDSMLLLGSLIRNSALSIGGTRAAAPPTALGVFAVTRHPTMWSVALWGSCHIAVHPVARNVVVAAATVVLALVGAAMQDRRKRRLQVSMWTEWENRTS